MCFNLRCSRSPFRPPQSWSEHLQSTNLGAVLIYTKSPHQDRVRYKSFSLNQQLSHLRIRRSASAHLCRGLRQQTAMAHSLLLLRHHLV